MVKFIILLAVIGLAIAVFNLLIGSKPEDEGTYIKRKILTDVEQRFYLKLQELVADRYYIFPQIHLANLLTVEAKGKNWKRLFNKVIQKSVDFVLVDKGTFEVKLIIELDDLTHLKDNRIKRDNFVNNILETAKYDLIRVRTADDPDLKAAIESA